MASCKVCGFSYPCQRQSSPFLSLSLSLSLFPSFFHKLLTVGSQSLATYVMEINCLLYMSFSSAYSISLDEDEVTMPDALHKLLQYFQLLLLLLLWLLCIN